MKRLFITLGILVQIMSVCVAEDQQPNRWQSVKLWSNNILSARLLFLSPASLADENILILEFDNRSGTPLDVTESFLNLDATYKDPSTGKDLLKSEVRSNFYYEGTLSPGITTATGDIVNCAREYLLRRQGLPSNRECLIDITAHCDAHLRDGQVFATPMEGINFQMDWKYPSPIEIANAQKQLSALLEVTVFKSGPAASDYPTELNRVITIPEVADTLTVDELLRALSYRKDTMDGRNIVSWLISRLFSADPKVIAYYYERLSMGDKAALSDLEGNLQIWNPTWIEPLVANFEKAGDYDTLRVLSFHREDWVTNSQDVSRLSAALFKYRPILHREVSSLATNELYDWCNAAKDVGVVGDKALIPVLIAALDDKRIVHHPLTQMMTPPDNRVCDAALVAILTILDGSPDSAFKQAGANYSPLEKDDKIRFSAFDRVIVLTKERLK